MVAPDYQNRELDNEHIVLKSVGEVQSYMDEHMAQTEFEGQTQKFLPRPYFEVVTAEDVIKSLVSKDEDLHLSQPAQDDFVRKVLHQGRKMFATCIFSEMSLTCVQALFEDKLTDLEFPFKKEDCPGLKSKRQFYNTFLVNQLRFNVAYFEENSEYGWDDRMMKPIDFKESSLLGQGAFGDVYEVEIHPEQRSFRNFNGSKVFALKVTRRETTRESSFHRDMANIKPHIHLLKCLTSFRFASKYYMVYEKADLDMETFMRHSTPGMLESTELAQQLFGLASALAAIHYPDQFDNTQKEGLLHVPGSGSHRAGYIHDIKPENILVFVYMLNGRKKYWFKLADFSCAKVNDLESSVSGKNRYSWKTESKSGTPVYRAPESTGEGARTSRPYDLWSLGCVYLELLVWFLEGYDPLEQFRSARQQHVSPSGREDEGFYFKPTDAVDFRLRDVVIQKIDFVRNQRRGILKDVADTIPALLQIEPKQRPTVERLVEDLKHVGKGVVPPVMEPVTTQNLTRRFESLSLPTYESDSSPDANNTGGPVVTVRFATEPGN